MNQYTPTIIIGALLILVIVTTAILFLCHYQRTRLLHARLRYRQDAEMCYRPERKLTLQDGKAIPIGEAGDTPLTRQLGSPFLRSPVWAGEFFKDNAFTAHVDKFSKRARQSSLISPTGPPSDRVAAWVQDRSPASPLSPGNTRSKSHSVTRSVSAAGPDRRKSTSVVHARRPYEAAKSPRFDMRANAMRNSAARNSAARSTVPTIDQFPAPMSAQHQPSSHVAQCSILPPHVTWEMRAAEEAGGRWSLPTVQAQRHFRVAAPRPSLDVDQLPVSPPSMLREQSVPKVVVTRPSVAFLPQGPDSFKPKHGRNRSLRDDRLARRQSQPQLNVQVTESSPKKTHERAPSLEISIPHISRGSMYMFTPPSKHQDSPIPEERSPSSAVQGPSIVSEDPMDWTVEQAELLSIVPPPAKLPVAVGSRDRNSQVPRFSRSSLDKALPHVPPGPLSFHPPDL